jgi:hypothetical protein
LYGCKTWSPLTLKEHKPRAFENKVLRRIFEPKKEDVTEDWGNMHNEEFQRVIKSRRV